MKPLDDFLQHINLYAPGCAVPTAYFGIRQAAIEFCERTKLWRYDDEFAVTVDDAEALIAPYGAVVESIEGAWHDGTPLTPKTVAWLDDHCSGWREGTLNGQPGYITQTEPNTLRLVPFVPGTLRLSLFLKPSQDTEDLPDFLADQHRMTIAYGALSHILAIPNQSFTNINLGMAFGQAFQGKLDALSTAGSTGQQRARVRTRGTFF